jgi:hypothetical protein
MKFPSIKYSHLFLFHLCLALVITLFTAWYPIQAGGPHGGAMKKADNYDYFIEVKVVEKSMFVYLMDTNLDDQSNKGISGEAKFFLAADSTNVNVPLQAHEDKAFIIEAVPNYSTCKIVFHVENKEVSAKFENQTYSVKKN